MTIAFAIFVASACTVGYVLIGYPLLLAFLARRFERTISKQERLESVSVIICVRNGERWLRQKLESVLSLDYPREMLEIIVVSDGSTDATEEIARTFADSGVRLLTVPPGGKPAALNAAVPHAKGDLLFLTDVRQILASDCLKRLVACMADPAVGVVSGNLIIRSGSSTEEESTSLYWRYESAIRRNLSRLDSMLGASGPVYLLRRRLFVPVPPDYLLDDVYLPMSVHLRGYRLVLEEQAVAIDEPTVLRSEFRRKVRTQAGILQLIGTFPGLFSRKNRMRFHFISLKIGRLLLPYLLLALLGTAWALPRPWRLPAAVPQVLFWLLALADPLIPQRWIVKRISAPARAFAVLVFAAVAALKILSRPARSLWLEARPAETKSELS
jgi:cellulose synthase/poly-beta-1,6-N-acetylglucosamine synthase-like glycosyltransferase